MNTWDLAHALTGGVASLIFLIQTLGSAENDSDSDANADFSGHFDGDGLYEYLSIRNFVAFFMGYGWVTFVALVVGFSRTAASLCGVAAGVLFVLTSLFIVRSFMRLHEDGSIKLEALVGQSASVYIAIGDSSPGKVLVDTKHGRMELSARTRDTSRIPAGQWVIIVAADGGVLWVSASTKEI
jgi:membrane protein implicated in regulation of membrane protease activity